MYVLHYSPFKFKATGVQGDVFTNGTEWWVHLLVILLWLSGVKDNLYLFDVAAKSLPYTVLQMKPGNTILVPTLLILIFGHEFNNTYVWTWSLFS